jgi:hypothetical protein
MAPDADAAGWTGNSSHATAAGWCSVRRTWSALALAMLLSAALILWLGRDTSFRQDEYVYYARLVPHGTGAIQVDHLSLGYFLTPHNGHLQAVGRIIYEGVFATAGPRYSVLRFIGVAGFLLSVGLFFELARRRIGPLAALAPSVLLLFLGFAWEQLLWPFDLHTSYSLAAGLGAMLALEKRSRGRDLAACILLTLSIATIELGLAFAVGVAVLLLQSKGDRWRRAWIYLVPVGLYAAWWIWARQFHQTPMDWSHIAWLGPYVATSLAVVLDSLTGLSTAPSPAAPTGLSPWAYFLAALATAAFLLRLSRGPLPASIWAFLGVSATYWALLALGARLAVSPRYLLVGAIGVLLIAADAARGLRFSGVALGALYAIVAIAIPSNIERLVKDSDAETADAKTSRTEYAMLELARGHVDPQYDPSLDRAVWNAGGFKTVGLRAGFYLPAVDRIGSIAFTPDEVRGEDQHYRRLADVTLARALRLRLDVGQPGEGTARASAARGGHCLTARPAGGPPALDLPPGGAALRSTASARTEVRLERFSSTFPVDLGKLPAASSVTLAIPTDRSTQPWRLQLTGPGRVSVCSRATGR